MINLLGIIPVPIGGSLNPNDALALVIVLNAAVIIWLLVYAIKYFFDKNKYESFLWYVFLDEDGWPNSPMIVFILINGISIFVWLTLQVSEMLQNG